MSQPHSWHRNPRLALWRSQPVGTSKASPLSLAPLGAGTAFLLPSHTVQSISHHVADVAPKLKAFAIGATGAAALPLAAAVVAVAARRTATRAVHRAPLLSDLEDAIQGKLEERLQRQQLITSEMQRQNVAFKQKLEEYGL